MHTCHMARLRRECGVRLNIKVTAQESQENMVKEQDMELSGQVRNSVPNFSVEGLGTYWFNENSLSTWEKGEDCVRSPVNFIFVSHFHFCSWV